MPRSARSPDNAGNGEAAERRMLGRRSFTGNVWSPSKYFPESLRPEKK